MTDLTAEKQAAKAIAHTLRNISERPGVAWYLGYGTQTYALLTEAHATLHGITMEQAQENWPPAHQPQYDADNLNQCPFCGSHSAELSTDRNESVLYVECSDCNAQGPRIFEWNYTDLAEAKSIAISKWNSRQMPR